jgi:hypothetical protein
MSIERIQRMQEEMDAGEHAEFLEAQEARRELMSESWD